jgi:hypothetical protein
VGLGFGMSVVGGGKGLSGCRGGTGDCATL